MNTIIKLTVLAGLTLGATEALKGRCCSETSLDQLQGTYLEGRSASVFAGACHVNGESDTQGRHALLAWAVDEGSWAGQELAGLRVAAAVSSPGNLAEGSARRTRLYVDAGAAPDQKERLEAARAWLLDQHAGVLGEVVSLEAAEVELELDGDAFSLQVPGVLELGGQLDPDRTCCTMPERVWYQPLAGLQDSRVALGEVCSFAGAGEDVPWSYPGQNNSFVGTFVDVGPTSEPACEALACEGDEGQESSSCCASSV